MAAPSTHTDDSTPRPAATASPGAVGRLVRLAVVVGLAAGPFVLLAAGPAAAASSGLTLPGGLSVNPSGVAATVRGGVNAVGQMINGAVGSAQALGGGGASSGAPAAGGAPAPQPATAAGPAAVTDPASPAGMSSAAAGDPASPASAGDPASPAPTPSAAPSAAPTAGGQTRVQVFPHDGAEIVALDVLATVLAGAALASVPLTARQRRGALR
jgi:hypothetical protein